MDYKKLYFDLVNKLNFELEICECYAKNCNPDNERNNTKIFTITDILRKHSQVVLNELIKDNK